MRDREGREDKTMKGSWLAAEAVLAVMLLTPLSGRSQQQSASSDPPNSGAVNTASVGAQDGDSTTGFAQQHPNAAGSQGLFVRELDGASQLVGQDGPLHWGWISLRSASFGHYFSHVNFSEPSIQPQSQDIDGSQLSTSIVIDHAFGAAHLDLQYAPSLFISDGKVYTNALNQSAGLDVTFQLNSRWGLQVTDRFSYYGSQRYFSELSLDANYFTGTLVQRNFLAGPGSVLVESVDANFSYLWSPLTTISFAPLFEYQHGSGAVTPEQASIAGFFGGGRFAVSHLLSPTRTVRLSYSAEYANFSNSSTVAGPQSSALLQDAMVTYNQQLKETLHLNLGLGVYGNGGSHGGTVLALGAGITKSFHRMEIAANYSRGRQFNGFVTAAASDRIDATHTMYWTPRFSTSTSAGYFRTLNVLPPAQTASYVAEQLNFGLTRYLSLSGAISYLTQTGDGVFVASGNRRFASVGITWSALSPARYSRY